MKINEAIERLNEFKETHGKNNFNEVFGEFRILLRKLSSEVGITADCLFTEWMNTYAKNK